MSRATKSQWEFGELFPAAETRQMLSVSELTLQIKRLLEKQVGAVWVTGEISNLRVQPSGHAYFTLKDAGAQLSCVLFRGEAANRDALEEGRKVNLHGDVTVYEARGQYQLRVKQIELQGIGALQQAFERLKQKLAAEGLFAAERKRRLPRYPVRIGIVTSPAAAAFRDVLHVTERRFAGLEIVLAPCRVQGEGAAVEIAEAIRLLNEYSAAAQAEEQASRQARETRREGNTRSAGASSPQPSPPLMGGEGEDRVSSAGRLDLILVTRGGGSLEDLWAFNEEVVARAIFESALPVVSAVGHEIDFTIADFVADVRAATPSAAAEIITAEYVARRGSIEEAAAWLRRRIDERLADGREKLEMFAGRLRRAHPRRRLEEHAQRLDDLHTALLRAARSRLRDGGARWQLLRQRFLHVRPARQLEERRSQFALLGARLLEAARQVRREWRDELERLETRLRLLSPEQVLSRGYSITLDAANGAVLRNSKEVKPGQELRTRLHRGEVRSVVEK